VSGQAPKLRYLKISSSGNQKWSNLKLFLFLGVDGHYQDKLGKLLSSPFLTLNQCGNYR